MKNGLLEFLYGASQRREEVDEIIDSDFVRIFEEAAEKEGQELAANKSSLVDALKGVGITPGEIKEESGYQCFETDDQERIPWRVPGPQRPGHHAQARGEGLGG
jgi:hypothetical protein